MNGVKSMGGFVRGLTYLIYVDFTREVTSLGIIPQAGVIPFQQAFS